MRRLSVCLVFLLAGFAPAQDITLSDVLLPGEGWQEVKDVAAAPGAMAGDPAGNVYVADSENKLIRRIGAGGKAGTFAKTSEAVGGLAFAGGVLYATLPGKQQIVRYDDKGKEEVVHEKTPARHLVVREGRIYYTSPGKKAVFLVGREEPVAKDVADPSGLALWNDGATLVVGDAAGRSLFAFRIHKDGALDAGDRYYRLRGRPKQASEVRAPGLDTKGWLYAATAEGVQAFDATGRLFGVLLRPKRDAVTALAFGGPERNSLFIVCGGKVWQRKTKVKGAAAP